MLIPEALLVLAAGVYVPFVLTRIPPEGGWERRLRTAARWIWLPAAAALAVSVTRPAGLWLAPALAAGWLGFTGVLALSGLLRLRARWGRLTLPSLLRIAALVQLPVGAAWLVASRAALEPMGFREPIVVLTAIHFHFAGCLAPVLAAEALEHLGLRGPARLGGLAVLAGPGLLAVGFVISPLVQVTAALIIAVGLTVLGVVALARVRSAPRPWPLALSWLCLVAGMALAGVYAVGEYTGQWWLNIAQMVFSHGLLNGVGFGLFGVAAWLGTRWGVAP